MLKLMYITNKPEIALIAEKSGVNRIFVDMEYIGKSDRQGGMDTVQSNHTIDDVRKIRQVLNKAELLVRVNPIHSATQSYLSSQEEIEQVIESGADIIMLPFFKTIEEVKNFLEFVGGRVRTMLLLETPESVEILDEILELPGIDEIHIGLNDLSLGYNKKFMFELLADGTVEQICNIIKMKGLPFGFGGIAALGKGKLPAERIIAEHYRLHSSIAILSRSFCNTDIITNLDEVERIFLNGISDIRKFEQNEALEMAKTDDNLNQIRLIVNDICGGEY